MPTRSSGWSFRAIRRNRRKSIGAAKDTVSEMQGLPHLAKEAVWQRRSERRPNWFQDERKGQGDEGLKRRKVKSVVGDQLSVIGNQWAGRS